MEEYTRTALPADAVFADVECPVPPGEDAASSRDLRRCKRLAAYLHARKKTAIVSIGTGLSALRRTYTPGTTFHNMVLVSLRLYCA